MYRSLVLESAETVFAHSGYHAAKVQDVAAEAGISLQTLYSIFASKREIFEELHEFRGREFLAHIGAALGEPLPARESLRRGVRAFVDYLVEHVEYLHVDLREGRSWAVGDVESSPAFQAGIALWTDLMRRGIEEGAFVDDDPGLMAASAFALMQVQLAVLIERERVVDAERIAQRIDRQLERSFCVPSTGD
jgi:AcrR family transcriptional regulator